MQITGLRQSPAADVLAGKVITSHAPEAGQFACSNRLLNQLWNNTLWTQRGNMYGVPTDCPQRSERMGWMSHHPFSQTAIFNMNMAAFYTKYVRDMRDAQFADGRFPDYTPFPHDPGYKPSNNTMGTPGWMEAAILIPWYVYLNYGNQFTRTACRCAMRHSQVEKGACHVPRLLAVTPAVTYPSCGPASRKVRCHETAALPSAGKRNPIARF